MSTDDSAKLINEVFRVICDLTNDEAKVVRVQAMKMIVSLCILKGRDRSNESRTF